MKFYNFFFAAQILLGGVGADSFMAAKPIKDLWGGINFDDFFDAGMFGFSQISHDLELPEPIISVDDSSCSMTFDLANLDDLEHTAINISSCCNNLVIVELHRSLHDQFNDKYGGRIQSTSDTSIMRNYQLPPMCDAPKGLSDAKQMESKKLVLTFPKSTDLKKQIDPPVDPAVAETPADDLEAKSADAPQRSDVAIGSNPNKLNLSGSENRVDSNDRDGDAESKKDDDVSKQHSKDHSKDDDDDSKEHLKDDSKDDDDDSKEHSKDDDDDSKEHSKDHSKGGDDSKELPKGGENAEADSASGVKGAIQSLMIEQ